MRLIFDLMLPAGNALTFRLEHGNAKALQSFNGRRALVFAQPGARFSLDAGRGLKRYVVTLLGETIELPMAAS